MSANQDDDINFNELVGNALTSHNEINDNEHDDNNQPDTELPEFPPDDAYLAAFANAIQNMSYDDVEDTNNNNDNVNSHKDDTSHNELDQADEDLGMAILQSLNQLSDDNDDSLDQATAQLILDTPITKTKSKTKSKPKTKSKTKTKAKSKTVKDKTTTKLSKKKKSKDKKESLPHKKVPESTIEHDSELLDFDDVINSFMHNEYANFSDPTVADTHNFTQNAETQALIDEASKAFERRLVETSTTDLNIPSTTTTTTTTKHLIEDSTPTIIPTVPVVSEKSKESKTKSKSKSKSKKKDEQKSKSSKSKKKKDKSKKKKSTKVIPDESHIDFTAKDLEDVVNNVVSKALIEDQEIPVEKPLEQLTEDSNKHDTFIPVTSTSTHDDDAFDLNQIMKNAMQLAFNNENESHENFASELTDFLPTMNNEPSSILSTPLEKAKHSLKTKKLKSKVDLSTKLQTDNLEKIGKNSKLQSLLQESSTELPSLISNKEALRKKLKKIAIEAASLACKRKREQRKALRVKVKEERTRLREKRKQEKQALLAKQEEERKELEAIVAKGPPYPFDLRLTKNGKPKKPYRRYTADELAKKALEANSTRETSNKVKKKKLSKSKDKESKSLKRSALLQAALQKIALLSNTPNDQTLNEIEGLLANIRSSKLPQNITSIPSNQLEELKLYAKNQLDAELKKQERRRQRKTKSSTFNFHAKTVVHKEKIPFHPPWILPLHPPYALPIQRKNIKRHLHKWQQVKKHHKGRTSKSHRISKNNIVPKFLVPIIKTLKLAAKTKIQSGSSKEEVNKHLMAILHATKRALKNRMLLKKSAGSSFGKLSGNNSGQIRNLSTIPLMNMSSNNMKTESDGKVSLPRIPIFSLSSSTKLNVESSILGNDSKKDKNNTNSHDIINTTKGIQKIKVEDVPELPSEQTVPLITAVASPKDTSVYEAEPIIVSESNILVDNKEINELAYENNLPTAIDVDKSVEEANPDVQDKAPLMKIEADSTEALSNADNSKFTENNEIISNDTNDISIIKSDSVQDNMNSSSVDSNIINGSNSASSNNLLAKIEPANNVLSSILTKVEDTDDLLSRMNNATNIQPIVAVPKIENSISTNSTNEPAVEKKDMSFGSSTMPLTTIPIYGSTSGSTNVDEKIPLENNVPQSFGELFSNIPIVSESNLNLANKSASNNNSSLQPIGIKEELPQERMPADIQGVLEEIVKEQLRSQNDGKVEFNDGISSIIKSTIENFLPSNDSKDGLDVDALIGTKYPPLNGAPPNSKFHLPIFNPENNPATFLIRKQNRLEQESNSKPANWIDFKIPKVFDVPTKRSIVLRYAKVIMRKPEMASLTKYLNNERKRKWRTENVLRNWEHETKARIKRRANARFKDEPNASQEEKEKWMKEEFENKLKVHHVTREDIEKSGSTGKGKNTGMLTEADILNYIVQFTGSTDISNKIQKWMEQDSQYFINTSGQPTNQISLSRLPLSEPPMSVAGSLMP